MRKKCEWKKGVTFLSQALHLCPPHSSIPSGTKDSPSLSDLHGQAADHSAFPTAGQLFKVVALQAHSPTSKRCKMLTAVSLWKQSQPCSPSVCWGFTVSGETLEWACWPGASAVVSRESCEDVRAWDRISAPLAWAPRSTAFSTTLQIYPQKVGHSWFHMQAQPLRESVLVHTCQGTGSSESLWEQVEDFVSRDISMGSARTFCPCVRFNYSGFPFLKNMVEKTYPELSLVHQTKGMGIFFPSLTISHLSVDFSLTVSW